MQDSRLEQRIISSAIWAAYGDALGFPTELATKQTVVRRIGDSESKITKGWRRLVGGKFGVEVALPAGTYSDDTQLRLATSRAIRGDGEFDVESFAKVELTVWLSYALGAGRGSKAAADSLMNTKVAWFSNFYSTKAGRYVDGGGNGAAMRVQPHVWSATAQSQRSHGFMLDVVRNAICTHGHVRGIAGAMIHAANLAYVLSRGSVPDKSEWKAFCDVVRTLPSLIEGDSSLSTFWKPSWEEQTGQSIFSEVNGVCEEWVSAVDLALSIRGDSAKERYQNAVEALGGTSNSERGSGLKCALFALLASWEFRDAGPEAALQVVANFLGSDTDSIGTMCGALLGALLPDQLPSHPLQDRSYIAHEARRMFKIGAGVPVESFSYPDLIYWQPPRSGLDSVGLHNGKLILAGLGEISEQSAPSKSKQNGGDYQWFLIGFGQSFLCKRRPSLKSLPETSLPGLPLLASKSRTPLESKQSTVSKRKTAEEMPDLFSTKEEKEISVSTPSTLDEMTNLAIGSGFDPRLIGELLLSLTESERYLEDVTAFAAIVAKAKRARSRRRSV